jgi:hypothetical protein
MIEIAKRLIAKYEKKIRKGTKRAHFYRTQIAFLKGAIA